MANIATLAVQLTAVTAPFTKGMKGATASVTGLQSAAKRTDAFIGGLATRFGGIVSVGAAASMAINKLRDSFNMLEEIGDESKALGASVENLNALRHAAAANGIEFEKLTGGVQKMAKAIGDVGQEKAFRQLGLDPQKLRLMDSVDAFLAVSKAIDKLPTAYDRAAAMQSVFGRSWIEIAELMGKDAVGGIDKMRANLKLLGLDITETDTKLVDAANTTERTWGAITTAQFDKAAAAVAKYKNNFFTNLTAISIFMQRNASTFSKFWDSLNPLSSSLRNTMKALVPDIQVASTETDNLAKSVEGLADAQKRQEETLKGFDKAMKSLAELGKRGREITESVMTPIEKLSKGLKEAFSLLQRGAISAETFDRYSRKLQEDLFGKKEDPIEQMKNALDTSSVATVGLSGALNYLRNVARGTQINGAMVSGPADAGRVQEVSDPQLSETNKYLAQIMDNTEYSYAVAG